MLPLVAAQSLLLALAHRLWPPIKKFGKPDFCGGGPLSLS